MVKKYKRFLCFLCCLALILALIPPLPASAAVASDHVTESSGNGYSLYNGVKLPNIDSVWTDEVKAELSYAMILKVADSVIDNIGYKYMIVFCAEPFFYDPSANGGGYPARTNSLSSATNGEIWEESIITPGEEGSTGYIQIISPGILDVLWTSNSIYNGDWSDGNFTSDGTIYSEASNPIPLDGMTVIEWDGDTTGLSSFGSMYNLSSYSPASSAVATVLYGDSLTVLDVFESGDSWSLGDGDYYLMTVLAVPPGNDSLSSGLYAASTSTGGYVNLFAYIPADSSSPYLVDGLWFMEDPSSGDDFSLTANFACEAVNFAGSGIIYDASLRQLTYTGNNMNDVVAWSETTGWLSEDYRTIVLDGEYSLDETAFAWFVSNAVLLQDAAGDVPNYTTVTIGDNAYRFWSYDQDNYSTSPDVTLTVAAVGSTIEYGLRSKTWTYSGDTSFLGFASQSDGEVAYSPGSNYTLAGAADQAAAYTLYPVSELSALTTTVFIDGVEHIFTGDSTELSPLVQLIVAEDTITLAGASGTYTFTPPEGNIFLGLAPSSSVAPTYPIGTYTLGREDTNSVYTLYTVLESLGPLLDTAVNVYSNSGTTLHDSYAASGYGTAPALTLTILDNGLQISNSAGVVSSWSAADPDFFLGFAMQRNASTPSFRPGQSFTIGGGSTNVLTDLYVVYSPGYSDINDFEVSSWLVSAVGGFLDFQLWPGMSLNEVMWIILVAGVLFWFLKLTI